MGKTLQQSILETSQRLRVVQQGFAEADQQQRTEYLGEELDRRLKEIPYGERRAFLQGLLAQFPTWLPDGSSGGDPARPSDEKPSEDPLHLAEALLRRLPAAAPGQREAVLDRLRNAVPELSRRADASGEASKNGKSTLGVSDGVGLPEARLGSLANLLTEFVAKLERWMASVWAEIPSKSTLRPPKHIEEIARRFLREETRGADEVTKELQLLQQFVTIIMAAARKAGDDVTRRHFQKFSPEAIQASVEMEPASPWVRLKTAGEIRYWRKYCELAQDVGTDYVDREIVLAMAEYADTVLKKLEQSAKTPGGV
jgi:hypothetical protein